MLFVITDWQLKDELCAGVIFRGFNPDFATVGLDNASRNGQSHSRSGRLSIADISVTHRAKEFFEYAFAHVRLNSRTRVFDAYHDCFGFARSGGDANR